MKKLITKANLKKVQGIKVENMISTNGNNIPNQFIIQVPGVGRVFQSYRSTIAIVTNDGGVLLDKTAWDYSVTTGKYRNQFLGCNKQDC